MKPIHTLRLLLVSAVLLAIAAGVCDALFPGALPVQSRESFDALLATRQAAMSSSFVVASVVYELILLAAVVGMMLLRRWGLMLGVVVTGITMVQAVLLGPHAYSGVAFMLSYASKVAWGASLALAFCLRSSGLRQENPLHVADAHTH